MNNIFEQFQGKDLDRFIACLQGIKQAGLGVDKYTTLGINDYSGNVWITSEDWPGCIYCSIDMSVKWSYFCSECGAEYDFDTYEAMCDYVKEYETVDYDLRCESCETVDL